MTAPVYIDITFKDRYSDITPDGGEVTLSINLDTRLVLLKYNDDVMVVDEDFYYKVVDTASYELLDEDGRVLFTIDDDYVPECIPNDYRDYLDIEIFDKKVSNFTASLEDIYLEFQDKGTV